MKKEMFLFLILLMGVASATCTVTFDKETYNQKETISATMSCSEVAEKLDDYVLNWTNSTGYVIESDSGTTPSSVDTNFFESHIIDENFVNLYGSNITATLIGADLEGSDFANITTAIANSLIITDTKVSPQFLIGRSGGIHFTLINENNKEISNARCSVEILDDSDSPVIMSEFAIITVNGEAGFTTSKITSIFFEESQSYAFTVHCSCGSNITNLGCWDSDGTSISEGAVSGVFSFDIGSWFNANTVVNSDNYEGGEEIFVCVNITNNEFSKRVPVEIYHQIRCSAGEDNENDTDRALVLSDDSQPDERGVDVGITQMQCKRFIVPEPRYLQGLSSECYASTSAWVLNENRQKIINYVTTSDKFNITIEDISIDSDWARLSGQTFNTVINLSEQKYGVYNARGIGNIKIRLDKQYTESIRAEDQFITYPKRIQGFISADTISSITIYNSTGGECESVLEVLDDGHIAIKVKDVDISSSGWINVTIEIENFDERQSVALEGIENKTGTFAFEITAKNSLVDSVNFDVYALLEISDQSSIEGFFSCYIEGRKAETEIQFEHAINKITPYETNKNLDIPEGLVGIQKIVCELGFLGFGNDKDIASDTFKISAGGEVVIVPEIEIEKTFIETIKDMADGFVEHVKSNRIVYWGVLVIIIVCMLFWCCKGEDIRKRWQK